MKGEQKGELGFTLVELIVVLVLLAILSTMVLTATSSKVDQTRYDKTTRTMDLLESAIFGELHGDGPAYGFLCDIGGFPGEALELWDPNGLPPYDFDEIFQTHLTAGWNGPYIQLEPNDLIIKDGWGNEIYVGPDPLLSDLWIIESLGRDGVADDAGGSLDVFDKDIVYTYGGNDLYGTIYFEITNESGGELQKAWVELFYPNAGIIEQSNSDYFTIPDPSSSPGPLTKVSLDIFNKPITCGFRAVRLKVDIPPKDPTPFQLVRVVAGGSVKVEFTTK